MIRLEEMPSGFVEALMEILFENPDLVIVTPKRLDKPWTAKECDNG